MIVQICHVANILAEPDATVAMSNLLVAIPNIIKSQTRCNDPWNEELTKLHNAMDRLRISCTKLFKTFPASVIALKGLEAWVDYAESVSQVSCRHNYSRKETEFR